MENADLPAMPIIDDEISTYEKEIHFGLTKRETVSIYALQGLLASGNTYGGSFENRDLIAKDALAHADALIKEWG